MPETLTLDDLGTPKTTFSLDELGTPSPIPNPVRSKPDKYTPKGMRPGDPEPEAPSMGREALRNLPRSLLNYASLGMTQPDTIGPEGIVNPITGIADAAKSVYRTFRHPAESFAQEPIGTVNTLGAPGALFTNPATAPTARGGVKGAFNEAKSPATMPVRFRGLPPIEISGPKALTYGGTGAAIGHHYAGWPGAVAGGAIGAGYPIVKGFVKGAREGYRASKELPKGKPSPFVMPQNKRLEAPKSEAAPETPPPASEGVKLSPEGVDEFLKQTKGIKLTPESAKKAADAIKQETGSLPSPVAKPLGNIPAAERETNLVNTLRANTERKNLEIGAYFAARKMTPEAVDAMSEAEFNAHIPNVKNASGRPYQASTGRNYHRTFEQAKRDVVNAMREIQGLTPPQK